MNVKPCQNLGHSQWWHREKLIKLLLYAFLHINGLASTHSLVRIWYCLILSVFFFCFFHIQFTNFPILKNSTIGFAQPFTGAYKFREVWPRSKFHTTIIFICMIRYFVFNLYLNKNNMLLLFNFTTHRWHCKLLHRVNLLFVILFIVSKIIGLFTGL